MTNFDRQLAAYVAAQLTAVDLDLRPKVERRWLPKFEIEDLTQQPRIIVAARSQSRTPSSRSAWTRRHTVQVGLMASLKLLAGGQVDDSKVDRLVDLAETLIDTVCALDPFEGASLVSVDSDPLYDIDAMESPGIFRSVLTFTYTRAKR